MEFTFPENLLEHICRADILPMAFGKMFSYAPHLKKKIAKRRSSFHSAWRPPPGPLSSFGFAPTIACYKSRLAGSLRNCSTGMVTMPFSSRFRSTLSPVTMIFLKESLMERNGRDSCSSFSLSGSFHADWM